MSNCFSRNPIRTVIALTLLSSACQAWKVENRPAEAVVRQNHSGNVAVTMNDLRWVVLKNPQLRSDSIVGTRIAGNTYGKERRTALSLRGVRSVETRRFSLVRTLGLGVVAYFVPTLYRLAVVEND